MPKRKNNPNKMSNKKEQLSIEEKRQSKLIHISNLSNTDLLDEVISLAAGDDWDGMFTKEGEWEFQQLKSELNFRLTQVGFI